MTPNSLYICLTDILNKIKKKKKAIKIKNQYKNEKFYLTKLYIYVY